MLVIKDFLPCILMGYRHHSQPIRIQVWKFLSTNISLKMEFSFQTSDWIESTPDMLFCHQNSHNRLDPANIPALLQSAGDTGNWKLSG